MNTRDFDYELPPERIAQRPLSRRDASRLLVLDRRGGAIEHRRFRDLLELLGPGDLLVFNDTRVIRARLVGRKPSGGRVELLLLEPHASDRGAPEWICLLRAARAPARGSRLHFDAALEGRIVDREGPRWTVRFALPPGVSLERLLDRVGRVPLPPYIERSASAEVCSFDVERYQTVYADRAGAVAAPTAGLHFSREMLRALKARGAELAFLTLHVGAGTFQPVRTERIEDHRLHEERFDLPAPTAEAVRRTREAGGRVVAVGTTVVRTLEWCARQGGVVRAESGRCPLFIYPGYRFRVVDALLTNFHLPRSTLLMLVCAFAGRERVLTAYREAINRGYRFYSYGDSMMIRSA